MRGAAEMGGIDLRKSMWRWRELRAGAAAGIVCVVLFSTLLLFNIAVVSAHGFADEDGGLDIGAAFVAGPRVQPRRQLKEAVLAAGSNSVSSACAATRYPASCLAALNGDPRAATAAPHDLVGIAIGIAHSHMATAIVDSQTLAAQVKGVGNANLTAVSNFCSEVTDLSAFHLQNSRNAINGASLKDVQAWLSGALTFATDCDAGLGQVSTPSTFVTQMKGRLDLTGQLISNALAMADALVTYGSNTAVWKPPPTTRQDMLAEIVTGHPDSASYPDWVSGNDQKHLNGDFGNEAPSAIVDLASGLPSVQHAVNLAPNWSAKR